MSSPYPQPDPQPTPPRRYESAEHWEEDQCWQIKSIGWQMQRQANEESRQRVREMYGYQP